MKKEIRVEGTAFTRRRREWTTYDTHDKSDEQHFAERMERFAAWSKDPWAAQRPLIDRVKQDLGALRARVGPKYRFKAREDVGWYLEELLLAARIVDSNITKGDARWAAFAGAKFGELWSELQLKLAREELFLVGIKTTEDRAAGGRGTRKTPDAVRVARWEYFFALTGKKTEADRLAAEELGEGESTIRNARKGAGASD